MKIFCLLLSALASTVVAQTGTQTALELLTQGWKHFQKGEVTEWAKLWADDAVIEVKNPKEYDFKYNGRNVNGQNGFTPLKFIEASGAAAEIFDFQQEHFSFNDNRAGYLATVVFRDRASGQRYSSKQLHTAEAKDGKLIKGSWTVFELEKVDAATRAAQALYSFKNGRVDPAGSSVFFDNLHKDFSLTLDMSYKEINGVYRGAAGFSELVAKQEELIAMDYLENGVWDLGIKVMSTSLDGKTAVAEVQFPYTLRATGARFHDTYTVVWRVDDHGKHLEYECLLDESKPINAAALFARVNEQILTDPAAGAKYVTEDYIVGFLGPHDTEFDTAGLTPQAVVDFKKNNDKTKLTFAKATELNYIQFANYDFSEIKMETNILSQEDHRIVIRFDATSIVNKDNGRKFDITWDQTWTTNEAGDKIARATTTNRRIKEVTSDSKSEL